MGTANMWHSNVIAGLFMGLVYFIYAFGIFFGIFVIWRIATAIQSIARSLDELAKALRERKS